MGERRPPLYSCTAEVISMLEGLQDKFVDERISLEKEEAAKKHSYEAWRKEKTNSRCIFWEILMPHGDAFASTDTPASPRSL